MNLKEYVTNLAINTPPPLTANAQRLEKERLFRIMSADTTALFW